MRQMSSMRDTVMSPLFENMRLMLDSASPSSAASAA